jgi:hypothetical protein
MNKGEPLNFIQELKRFFVPLQYPAGLWRRHALSMPVCYAQWIECWLPCLVVELPAVGSSNVEKVSFSLSHFSHFPANIAWINTINGKWGK